MGVLRRRRDERDLHRGGHALSGMRQAPRAQEPQGSCIPFRAPAIAEGIGSAYPGYRHDARAAGTRLLRDDGRTGTLRPRCEFVNILSGEECRNPGEDRYEGTLLCRPHAVLFGLEYRFGTLRDSLSVLDHWLEDNAGRVKDEVRVQRMKHWREEVMEQLASTGLQLEAVREELE
jgi:hypothetical protein